MLFSVRLPLTITLALLLVSLLGCGEKTGVSTNVSKLDEAQICLACHYPDKSRITQKTVEEEWTLSAHNTKNGASCGDCHTSDPSHASSTGCANCHQGFSHTYRTPNPDSNGSCSKCHNNKSGFDVSTFNGKERNTLTSHFNYALSSYVSSQNVGKCRNCHNPHDTSSQMDTLRAWARSGHGSTDAPPWNTYDFKSRVGDCNRCHTTTGFIKYITTGDSKEWGSTTDLTKEMLECRACHIDYSYKLRQPASVTAKYTGGSVNYPDIGTSNLCINCHVGRESGATIKNIQRNYTSASFVNSHYLTAGGIVFGEIGYEYDGRAYSDPSGYRHRYIGTSDSRGNSAAESTRGPCVGCHLSNKTQPGEKHTFKPYITTGTALSPTCETSGCHGITATRATPSDQTFLTVTWQPRYQATLSALNYFLANSQFRKLFFNSSNPYFFRDSNGDGVLATSEAVSTNTQKKWHSVGGPEADLTVSGKNNMGAAFNYNLLIHDRGGVIHNRYYTRRLIYDSIDWLDDNIMNFSVGTSLNALPGTGTTIFKSEAITYLIDTKKTSGTERY